MNYQERIYNILTESTPAGREASRKHGREMGQWIGQELEAIKTARRHPDRERGEYAEKHTIPKEIGLWKSFARRKGRELVSTDPKTKATRKAEQKLRIRSKKHAEYKRGLKTGEYGPKSTMVKKGKIPPKPHSGGL